MLPFLAQADVGGVDTTDPFYPLYTIGWLMEPVLPFVSAFFVIRGLFTAFPLLLHRMYVHQPNPGLGVTRLTLGFAVFWFWLVLQTGAASDILGFYTVLYALLSLAVLFELGLRRPVAGVYLRADVFERGNLAAALTIAGFAIGTTFAFGGALTGEGPGWWVVIVFFVAAYIELRGNMALVARLGGVDEEMRLERETSAGMLLGAVAIASGLVSGRAAAGDFTGWERDIPDYLRRLWPLFVIALVGVGIGAYTRYSERKMLLRGIGSAALVIGGFAYYFFT